jgi:lipoprotein-anchoring transpeptidase ErfK/SrfK
MAIVSIESQHVTIYDADGWILRAPVSSGTTGRETPSGVFTVVQKDKDHRSNLYDDAWMPHMLRITWSGIALHGGPLPGYAASHGCVRMPYDFADNCHAKPPALPERITAVRQLPDRGNG